MTNSSRLSPPVSRRALFERTSKGVATLAMAGFARSLLGTTHAAPAKSRLVIYMSGSGIDETIYRDNRVTDEQNFDFVGAMAPLQKIKAKTLFMDKFFNLTHVDQHGNAMAALTCAKDLRGNFGYQNPRPGGPSFDYFLANKMGVTEPFPVVPMGLRSDDNLIWERSASGRDRVAPCFQTARAAFDRLFGALRDGQDLGAIARRRGLLTKQLLSDAKIVSRRLGAEERVRIDEYTESLSMTAARLDRWAQESTSGAGARACMAPDPATVSARSGYKIIDQEVDLVPHIFRCGLSRLVTIVGQPGGGWSWFPGFNGDGVSFPDTRLNQHDMSHQYLDAKTRDSTADRVRGLYAYHANNVARLYQSLAATKDGDGTLADSTTILWFSDAGGNHHNGWKSNPVILVGGNGKIKTGRYLRFPLMRHSMAEVFLTVGLAMGAPIESFGDGTDPCRGPIPGVLG